MVADLQQIRSRPSEWEKLERIDILVMPFTAHCAVHYLERYYTECLEIAQGGRFQGEQVSHLAKVTVARELRNCPAHVEALKAEENRRLLAAVCSLDVLTRVRIRR